MSDASKLHIDVVTMSNWCDRLGEVAESLEAVDFPGYAQKISIVRAEMSTVRPPTKTGVTDA